MKKASVIILLIILFLQAGGLFLFYKIYQCEVQEAILETINKADAEFHELTLSLIAFKQSKINDHELSYNGNMYDFKSFTIFKDSVRVLVIHDIEEENILYRIKDLIENIKLPKGEWQSKIFKLLLLVYTYSENHIMLFFEHLQENISILFIENIFSVYHEVFVPPPKCLV